MLCTLEVSLRSPATAGQPSRRITITPNPHADIVTSDPWMSHGGFIELGMRVVYQISKGVRHVLN